MSNSSAPARKAAAEARFRARIAELGGTVVGEYASTHVPVAAQCGAGHSCSPRPHEIARGEGMCRQCPNPARNAFYVVANEHFGMIKFGVSSGDPRPRLSAHRRDGLVQVLRLHRDLPGSTAPRLEAALRATLSAHGYEPVRGREYFAAEALPRILRIVDAHLA